MDKPTPTTANTKKRQTFIIPKRSLLQKYPKTFVWVGTTVGLAIFFSRPLYDAFFRTEFAIAPEDPDERRAFLRKQWKI